MKIRITKCSGPNFWYSDCAGKVFDVTGIDGNDFLVLYKGQSWVYMVDSDDCEIVHAPRCPHCGGSLEDK